MTKLPKSTRNYIRSQKAKLRRLYGPNSEQEKELYKWVKEKKESKRRRINKKK